jgi:5-methyltetrahydrofolate--homocysteine methyltransferase
MDMSSFIVIGENIHCTRVIKAGGKSTVDLPGGGCGVAFRHQGADRVLPVPGDWARRSPAYTEGKLKHIALAIRQAHSPADEDRQAGEAYLDWAAQRQVEAGAAFLDVNADEYTNDPAERAETMRWLADFLLQRVAVPLSIDSSHVQTVVAGLEACRSAGRPAMVNSVSLERAELVDVIRQYGAEAVVSAVGRTDLPTDVRGRLANFQEIVGLLDAAGVGRPKMHLDPLVFPVSTEPMHGHNFLEATRQARRRFAGAHLSGGFSNVSFGMPQRKLLNMVFVRLAVEAGAGSGIIDPVQTPVGAIADMDTRREPFRLARAFLTGDDMYGTEFIAAHREGKLG